MNAVAKHIHFRGGRVAPTHGDLDGVEAVMSREVKQFGIETEALDALLFKKNLAAFAAEGFEAALRVDKRQTKDHTDDGVKDDAGEFAETRLVDGDETTVERAG